MAKKITTVIDFSIAMDYTRMHNGPKISSYSFHGFDLNEMLNIWILTVLWIGKTLINLQLLLK